MKNSHIITVDAFSKNAKSLRALFDKRFKNPHNAQADRFVWDYWHVPKQYTVLRTPAYHYFPDSLYLKFHKEIIHWGRQNLGCWDISPPWLSCYVEGCYQGLHSDIPHGPWAWVLALTPKEKKFTGGETLIFKPEVLNYWGNFTKTNSRETDSFIDLLPSEFNRLTVFDPRYPHGVTEVRGTQDPREGRLVIHGWFTEPKTYIEGPLKDTLVEAKLNEGFDQLMEILETTPPTQGVVSLRLNVGRNGLVKKVAFKTNTLVHINGTETSELNKKVLKLYSKIKFPHARGDTIMTVPLIFG